MPPVLHRMAEMSMSLKFWVKRIGKQRYICQVFFFF
jgi:hypothetical protein